MRLLMFVYINLHFGKGPVEFCVYDVIKKNGISKRIDNIFMSWRAAKYIIQSVHDGVRLRNLGETMYIVCASYEEKVYLQETNCPVLCIKEILPKEYGLLLKKHMRKVDPSRKHDKCLTIATVYANFLEEFNA
ncbi:unnamed protein product, partial [Larinioides sclopetarius]